MSADINSYYENASLSMASYANLTNGMLLGEYVKELIKNGMSENQAIQFAQTYTVIDQYTDSSSGFSGTLFRNVKTGEYTFALRGTEPGEWIDDIIFADFLGIVVEGWAQDQINVMNAYFDRLITPVSEGGLEKLSPSTKVINPAIE